MHLSHVGLLCRRGMPLWAAGLAVTAALLGGAPSAAVAAGVPVRGYLDVVSAGPGRVTVAGWALRPGSSAQLTVTLAVNGSVSATGVANRYRPDVAAALHTDVWHGYHIGGIVKAGVHHACVLAAGVLLGCRTVRVLAPVPPGPVTALSATASAAGAVRLSWHRPASAGSSPLTGYTVTTAPPTRSWLVAAAATGTTVTGLNAGTRYTLTVAARNTTSTGRPAAVTATPSAPPPPTPTPSPSPTPPAPTSGPPPYPSPSPTPSLTATPSPSPTSTPGPAPSSSPTPPPIPPQTTPAPVSTSHYLRSLTGSVSDVSVMRALGGHDAPYNPSGHAYLALLDIGGQDERRGGVVLSATTRFVSYPQLVTAVEAYLDGYASTQKPAAPMTIAVGTNNDTDVTAAAGASWMTHVVAPIRAYAARYPQLRVVGADDMEPGFSATISQTRAWLSGYLAAGTVPFVFNGSADGCPTARTGGACNNGWRQADLAWLAGGAAPSRISVLPQIYNTAMPAQWAQISATGTPALVFDGPLTEWTACTQAGGCASLPGVIAWTSLWNALHAIPRIAPSALPNATDLDIH